MQGLSEHGCVPHNRLDFIAAAGDRLQSVTILVLARLHSKSIEGQGRRAAGACRGVMVSG
jgi:hypothetical protein